MHLPPRPGGIGRALRADWVFSPGRKPGYLQPGHAQAAWRGGARAQRPPPPVCLGPAFRTPLARTPGAGPSPQLRHPLSETNRHPDLDALHRLAQFHGHVHLGGGGSGRRAPAPSHPTSGGGPGATRSRRSATGTSCLSFPSKGRGQPGSPHRSALPVSAQRLPACRLLEIAAQGPRRFVRARAGSVGW